MKIIKTICQLLIYSLISTSCYAFDWTSSNIQLLYGSDFKLGNADRTTVAIEHVNGWKYGQNFFFIDIIDRSGIGVQVYAELYSFLSLSKISGADLSMGVVKDISLFAGLNISNKPEHDHFKAYIAGLSFNLANPYFNYLQFDMGVYKSDDVKDRFGFQLTPVWSFPFQLASIKLKFRGYTHFRTSNTNNSGNFYILAKPQLLVDIGDLMGIKTDTLHIGTEYSYWLNKFGIKGVNESVVQALLIASF